MTCHIPSERQKKYAKDLLKKLKEDPTIEVQVRRMFSDKVRACICIAGMSDLIDEMKDALGHKQEELHAN